METRFLPDRRVRGNEQRKELWGNGHVGEFAEKETLYTRGHVGSREARSLAGEEDRVGPSSVPCLYAIMYACEKKY